MVVVPPQMTKVWTQSWPAIWLCSWPYSQWTLDRQTTKRYDVRGELNDVRGFDKIKLGLTYVDYFHDEKDPSNPTRNTGIDEFLSPIMDFGHPSAIFKNKGFNSRLDAHHTPISVFGGTLKGVAGVQYQTQKASATIPYLPSYGDTSKADPRYLLVPRTNKNTSVFML